MTDLLASLLDEKPFLLADGATGTNLFTRGLVSGDAPELWNIDRPDDILWLHQGFVDAGADIILTNTFGGNHHRMKLHDAQGRVGELNRAAVALARRVADAADRPVVIAGSMGPTGELPLEKGGTLSGEEFEVSFAEQAQALADAGADVLWAETLYAPEELEAAAAGAAPTGLPFVSTMTFDSAGHTMMGLAPGDYGRLCRGLPNTPMAFGANCGIGPAELLDSVLGMTATGDGSDVIVAKGNCGIPSYEDGALVYSGTIQVMEDYARLARDAGARIIGGCCGTSHAHVAAMRAALDAHTPGATPDNDRIAAAISMPWANVPSRDATDEPGGARRRRRRRSTH